MFVPLVWSAVTGSGSPLAPPAIWTRKYSPAPIVPSSAVISPALLPKLPVAEPYWRLVPVRSKALSPALNSST